MSLLPNQILPETVPIGTVNDDGSVSISHNWYLLFYNYFLHTLSPDIIPEDIILAQTFLPRVTYPPVPSEASGILQGISLAPRVPSLTVLGNAGNILENQVFGG